MLYTELLRLWDEAVKAVDAKDWHTALEKLDQITEPTSRTLFITATVNIALQQLEPALEALNHVIVKDERLAVGFFQRAGVLLQLGRLDDSLSDYIWAQKHMRGNMVIDYKQLGLHYKLHSWQVLYNSAAVYSRMGLWDQAMDILLTASQERPGGRGGYMELAMDTVTRGDVLTPLMVPEGGVFRPRKQDVEQLQQRDFLGKAKVISSMFPNDDFGGFEPLRTQRPGYYEPNTDGLADSHYMRMQVPYMARNPGQLTVPGGATIFIFKEVDRDGMVTAIYDGQRGLLPVSLLEPANVKTSKCKSEMCIPRGIPLPPSLKPPTRPQTMFRPAPSPQASLATTTPPPPNNAVSLPRPQATEVPRYTPNVSTPTNQDGGSAAGQQVDSVIVKVHHVYTVALTVPSDTPYHELQQRIARKLGQPAVDLRLRHKQHGSQVLTPLKENAETGTLLDVIEDGRVTLWCQTESPLTNRTILYQMVALYDYAAEGPEDLPFSEGNTIDILSEVNEEWLEGHCTGNIGIFPRCFAYREISRDNGTIL